MKPTKGFTMSAVVLAASLAASAVAAPSAQDYVTARQAGFKKMATAYKALNDQLKSGSPNKAAIVASAQMVAATAREQPRLFPIGSGPAGGVKTDALPAIWTDRSNFDVQMAKLVGETAKLASLANGGDIDAIRAQTKATGAVCGACHRAFRAD